MSAEDQGSAAPVEAGPTIITVVGQDGYVEPSQGEGKPAEVAAPVVEEKKEPVAGSEEQANKDNRDEKGRFKPGVQDRIDELTRARRAAERDAEYWKTRAQSVAPAKAADAPQQPQKADFESEDAYIEALADFKVEQKLSAKLAERDQQQQAAKANESRATSWQSKLEAARSEIQGFDEAMNSADTPVAAHVAELIMESDHGAKIAHYFATNPDELGKINDMPPAKAAMALGRLETKFEAKTDAPAPSSSKPATDIVSKAPPPAARNVGSGRSTETSLGDLPMDDYIARRKAQGAGWAR